tara:strand:- start:19 stop:336 length:318 start_codon:yes stop_codon:yes gene_type:complete
MDFWVVYLEDVEIGKLRVSSRSPFSSLYEAQRYADGIAEGRNAKVLVEATHGVGLGLITEHARANGQRIQEKKEQKKRTDAYRKKLEAKGIKLPKRKKELDVAVK